MTYSFETHVLRGRTEREYPVEVEWRFTRGGRVYITRATIIGETYDLTWAEYEQLQEEAEAASADLLADIELEVAAPSEGRAWGRAAA